MVHALPAVADAVNSPEALILPHEADQVTGLLAENCWVCPWAVTAVPGEMVMGEVMLAAVDPFAPLPLLAVAVITQEPAARGAVKSPADEMVPQEAVNVDAVLAVNCWLAPSLTVGFCGLTVTVVFEGDAMMS
jgi:hypothetical protein